MQQLDPERMLDWEEVWTSRGGESDYYQRKWNYRKDLQHSYLTQNFWETDYVNGAQQPVARNEGGLEDVHSK